MLTGAQRWLHERGRVGGALALLLSGAMIAVRSTCFDDASIPEGT